MFNSKPCTPPFIGRRQLLLGALLGAAAAPAVWAQGAVRQGPLRLVVPFTPGTGIDLVARQIAAPLSERLKRPVIIDNKPGASGNIGTLDVVRSPPDGHTLLVSVNTLVMNPPLYPKAGFNPLTDLAPVSITSRGQLLLVAGASTKIETLNDLMARAKAKPGALNYGSPGAGKLQALAISSDKPNPLLPQVPPLGRLNLGDLNVDMWYGVLAPAGTPQPEIDKLNAELRDILALPAVASAFETQGMTPEHSTPDAFRQVLAADARRWADLIKAQGITAE